MFSRKGLVSFGAGQKPPVLRGNMKPHFAIAFVLSALFALSAHAAAPQTYVCAEVKDDLAKKPELAELAAKAFGPLQYRAWSEKEPCTVPTAILKYRTQTVLISTAEPPYQGHACQATLSAHVFVPEGKSLKLSRTLKDFAKTGENCLAGTFKPVTIGGKDAFALEGSGGGHGARAGWLEFYRFDAGAIQQVKLPGMTCVSVDYRKAGPAAADMQNIDSSWRIGGPNNSKLFLDFHVAKANAKGSMLKTEWAFGRDGLRLVRGRTPETFADGACL
jgi:hypothetical protein